MSVTQKIWQNHFDDILLPDHLERIQWFRCKLSCNRDIFQITFQNSVVRIIFVYRSICFLTPALVEVSYEFSPVRPFFRPSDGNVRSHR